MSFWTAEKNWARNQRDSEREKMRKRERERLCRVQAPRFIRAAAYTTGPRRQPQQERGIPKDKDK